MLVVATAVLFATDTDPEPDDEDVWREFDGRIRPSVFRFALGSGLGVEEASDVAQETLLQFLRDYGLKKYVRERGGLRAWVFGIARHRVMEELRKKRRRRDQRGESAIARLPDEETLQERWNAEWRSELLRRSLRLVFRTSDFSATTRRAFQLVALEGRSPVSVAEELGISVNAVYTAKYHCMLRLRKVLGELREREQD